MNKPLQRLQKNIEDFLETYNKKTRRRVRVYKFGPGYFHTSYPGGGLPIPIFEALEYLKEGGVDMSRFEKDIIAVNRSEARCLRLRKSGFAKLTMAEKRALGLIQEDYVEIRVEKL